MTPSADRRRAHLRAWSGPLLAVLAILAVALLVAGCFVDEPTGSPGAPGSPAATASPGGTTEPAGSPAPTATPEPSHPPVGATPLTPAPLKPDPVSLLAWAFTPIFQTLFITLVIADHLVGNIAVAIIVLTLLLRILLIPLFRRQLVSQRRMQMLQPELAEIKKRYKGDRMKVQVAQQELMRDRGVSPLSGCLPIVLQFFLLIPIYSVFSQGLQNYDVQPMLDVFGVRLIDLNCPTAPIIDPVTHHVTNPCLNPFAFGVNWGVPEVIIGQPGALLSGLSLLAVVSALLQLVQSRMMVPANNPATASDPNVRIQRQMALLFPFFSLIYGSILPAGLFLYWIVSTIFSIVQQYLIIGWGGMFPLFGRTPAFAVDHTPRFPVSMPPPPDPSTRPPSAKPSVQPTNRSTSADRTIRSRERGRQGRRGRRR